MDVFLSINWIAIFVLMLAFLAFRFLTYLSYRINWTLVILIALAIGAVMGIVFASEGNSYLVWLDLIGSAYIKVITALVAPVIFISIVSGFISLKDKDQMKKIGGKSVFWLMISAGLAIVLSIFMAQIVHLGSSGGAVFSEISSVSEGTISAYEGTVQSFHQVLLNLVPANVIGDLASNNVVAIIITAIVIALAYVHVASEEGEEKVISFKKVIEAMKAITYKVLEFVINLTPYAVLCLFAVSASQIFSDKDALLQLILLVGMIYLVCLLHMYVVNGFLLRFAGKLNPFRFFKKTLRAQVTAFTTQSSVGTLAVSIKGLVEDVGVDEEVANFTTPLGTAIGMPGCTCIWPVLLAIFYVNAAGLNWGVGDYLVLALLTWVLSLGSAGVPGIGVVSAIAVFTAVKLPIAAVVLLMPINSISDMIRTANNVTTANVVSGIVSARTGLFNHEIFNSDHKPAQAKK